MYVCIHCTDGLWEEAFCLCPHSDGPVALWVQVRQVGSWMGSVFDYFLSSAEATGCENVLQRGEGVADDHLYSLEHYVASSGLSLCSGRPTLRYSYQ